MEFAVIWLVLMVGTFYLLLWRPQQRRLAAARELQQALRAGDDVVTTSGIFGTVVAADDDVVHLEVAPGTVIRIARGAIGQRLGEVDGGSTEPDGAE